MGRAGPRFLAFSGRDDAPASLDRAMSEYTERLADLRRRVDNAKEYL
jgi:hypothetical protein